MKLEDRQSGLLKLVEQYRDQECARLLDAARAEAKALIAETYRKERAFLHSRIVGERSRAQARIQAARAERSTRERWSSERASLGLLTAAWPRLRACLASRWADPEGRRTWAERYLREALIVLPKGRWEVRHAAEWGEADRRELAAELTGRLGQAPRFETDGRIAAGLVIACEGAVLDATLDGLLQDRARLEARLLALLAAD
jgi:hypothetical protein